jgi:hypothetical protein
MMSKEIANALRDVLMSPNVEDSNGEIANAVDTLNNIAKALWFGVKHLGLNDADSPLGALENLALEVRNGSQCIADGLNAIAHAITSTVQE